jgi:MoaA/NifB/PqqE/SkfB family radical SAM enzyme
MLPKFARSASRFAALGFPDITISGGDPLLIDGLSPFLDQLRNHGIRSIKLDTVGRSLAINSDRLSHGTAELLTQIDILGIPLDGWSNASSAFFRHGRASLFDETCTLFSALDGYGLSPPVYVNSVLHRLNLAALPRIYRVLAKHRCVYHWNIFQYTPTDQAAKHVNNALEISDSAFELAKRQFSSLAESQPPSFEVEFASVADRLGKYLLINSDGLVWMPDGEGRTICLGAVFDREEEILHTWHDTARCLREQAFLATA